jgi:hypothetical protein
LFRDEDDSSDNVYDPANLKITKDVQFLHGLPVSRSGMFSELKFLNLP